MAGRYKKSQNKNRSRFYILLSVIFVFVMFKWGLPLFMNLVAGSGAQRINTDNDIIPPQSPIISALPDATNSARIVIEGFTEVGASVELLLNDSVDKITKADETGSFIFETSLISGQNRVQLRAKDETGNESMSEVTLVTYDNKPVELTVTSPKDGSEYFGKINQAIDIKGEVDKAGSQILINGSFVQVDRAGAFLHRFMLTGGENIINIVASDKAGNTAEKTLRLIYTP
jgi:bacillopeptidase F